MIDCSDVNKLEKDRAGGRQDFVLLSLLTQWALDCLKQIKDESRMQFPREQEQILFDKIKVQVKTVNSDLIQIAIQDLKFIAVSLRDYKVGENVNFNKFLVECLLSSYKSVSNEMKKSMKKAFKQKFYDFLQPGPQNELDRHLDSSNKAKIDSYLNIRRDVFSLCKIYYTIESVSVEKTFEVNHEGKSIKGIPSIEDKRLALQRVFHITGEYVKDTPSTPNLLSDVRQSLEEKGVPTKALSKYRDTLAHYQIFPLIHGNDNQVKELFEEYFLPIQKDIKSTIIETEDSFVQKIIEEKGKVSKIDKSVVKRLIESKSRKGVQGLEECIKTMQSENKYRSMDNENKKFVDDVYQIVLRMESRHFSIDSAKPAGGKLSEKKSKPSNSIIEYINQSNLDVYNKLRDEIGPNLEKYAGELNNAHGDVVKIQTVIDRLSYKGAFSSNKNSIFDNFLSQPILEKIIVKDGRSLKKELDRYYDAKSFKNNDAYVDFKDSNPKNLIDLLNNNISGPNANKNKLIGFFEDSKKYYIKPEEYEQLVHRLGIKYDFKEKLLSFSVEWRKKKCVDLLKKNSPALKTIYDHITEGKPIDLSVYDRFGKEYQLPQERATDVEKRVKSIEVSIKDLYSRRVREEVDVLKKVKNPYAMESQVLNVYSLSDRASEKEKKNEKKGDKETKLEFKKLRNYLAHGDSSLSIKDDKTIANQLVEVKNEKNVIDMLNDPNINLEKIERTMDSFQSYVGVKNIRQYLCPPDQPRRSTRSVSKSCLRWAEIDKFNKGGAKNRDPDNIIIDSEKFISSISSELGANEEKFLNFIDLASESVVIGDDKNKVNMLTDKHRYLGHLERVGKVSGMVMHGMIGKTLVVDILRGDYKDLAINVGFLAANPLLAKVADVASMKGAGYILKGKAWRGKSLKIASPFISSALGAFTVYDLVDNVKKYGEGDKDALIPLIGNSVDVAIIGVEIGEAFGLLSRVSAITGPAGMAVGTLVSVGTGVYTAVRTVEKIDEYIHLTGWEKFKEGFLAFFGLGSSDDIKKLIEEKNGNNEAVKNAARFLKDHPQIQRYIFPSIEAFSMEDSVSYANQWDRELDSFRLRTVRRLYTGTILDNVVLLDRKRNDIKWSRTRPDNLEGIDLFCLPTGDSVSTPVGGTYYCDGAIGVEYTDNRTGNDTLINLGAGKDVIEGFQGSNNTFVFAGGHKIITGGNKDDYFVFSGNTDNRIEGSIDGRGGIDTIDVSELPLHNEWSYLPTLWKVSADFREGILKDTSQVNLNVRNINVFLGRKGGVDEVVFACHTKHVDGRGGENKNYLDSVIIPKDDACYYDTEVRVNPYTKVTNNATRGNFRYFVKGEKGKEAYIELGPSSQSNNTFVFNYTLKDVAAIDKSEKNITFSFIEDFYKREKKIDVNSSFNLTVSGADKNITTYHLIDSTKIVIGQDNVYAIQHSEKPIDSLVKDYSSIADKLQMQVIVYLNGEVLTVGNSHWDVFMNDPNARTSHLVGGGGENVFVITSGHEKLTLAKLPISDVVIYDFDEENKTDTLDLQEIKEQLKKDVDREINTEVSRFHSDLLINLSIDDASKKEVVKITLKGALKNNRYKRVHIDIDNIFVIEEILEDFELTPKPLIFDDNSITIYVINPTDVAKGSKIIVKKKIGDYIFARNNDALFITNSLNSSADKNNLFTIILNDFYYGNNQDKMQSLKIEFNDQKIFLRKEIERMNSAENFTELKRKVRIDSFKAVIYAIKEQKLFEAIEGNNIDEVKELIDHGVSIDARNNNGQTPLHSAAKSGKLEVVKYLIEEKGANVNAKDNSKKIPLHLAAKYNSLDVVKYFIEEKGADVNAKDYWGLVTLQYAVESGNLEVVKYLIEEIDARVDVRDDWRNVLLHYAVESGNLEVVKYLIEKIGADVNVKNFSGMVPLHYAVISGNLEVVKYLIEEKGANVNAEDRYHSVPLHLAAEYSRLEIVKYLIEEKGADINVMDYFYTVPLHLAAEYNKLDVVKYLIEEKGADVNVKGNSGKLTLHYAVMSGNLEVVKYLIEEIHADVNAKDDSGMIPLHYAVISGNLELVKYLVEEKGTDIDVKDNSGMVPLHLAALNGKLGIVKYLVEDKGADIDVRDNFDKVPLHYAASNSSLNVVKYLVEEKGADIDVRDNSGMVPLHLTASDGNLEVVRYLIEEKGADIDVKDNSGEVPLHLAALNGQLGTVKYLVGKGAKIDLKINGKTPLNILEIKGYKDVVDSIVEKLTKRLFDAVNYDDFGDVQDLINQGVSVNVKNSEGVTLLLAAAGSGNLKVLKYLLKGKQFDSNAKGDYLGRTSLHVAALYGKLGVVKYLIEEKSADVNVKDNSGITPLHYAVINGNLDVVKYLIEEKGADINVRDDSKMVPLHLAAKYNSLEVIKYLIEEKGADVNVKDESGKVPLHYGVISGNLEVVKYLTEKKGADFNERDYFGSTPLDIATGRGHNIVEYLKEKLNEKREKLRQYKRSHRHLSRLLLSTDSSNQPEIATSNASEKSSWINDLVRSIVKLQESAAPSVAASSNHPIRHERRKRHNDHSRHEDSMRMHRVRHRHRRVQKRNVKYQDSHYYIDQPEIATSSGTRPTSWINGLVDWIKEKGGGLVSSVADKFAAKESEDSKPRGIHACSVRLEKMYSATIPNIPQSRKSQGVPKGNIPNTSWPGWSFSREKVTSNVTDAPEMITTVINNALILGDLAVRLANGTRHKQPIHENLLSLREKSMRFIDENMIMRTIQQGKEKFGGLYTNMDV